MSKSLWKDLQYLNALWKCIWLALTSIAPTFWHFHSAHTTMWYYHMAAMVDPNCSYMINAAQGNWRQLMQCMQDNKKQTSATNKCNNLNELIMTMCDTVSGIRTRVGGCSTVYYTNLIFTQTQGYNTCSKSAQHDQCNSGQVRLASSNTHSCGFAFIALQNALNVDACTTNLK